MLCLLAQTVYVFNHLAPPVFCISIANDATAVVGTRVGQPRVRVYVCCPVVCFVSGSSQLCDLDVSDHVDTLRTLENIEI